MVDRLRGVVQGGLGGEALAECTHVREQLSAETSLRRHNEPSQVETPTAAKPSNPGPLGGSSRINGRRFRSPCTLARGVISLPAVPRTATPVRFDFCSDKSRSEAHGI